MEIIEKTRECAGADEKTPSHSQYFSWVNNTNEGSTEKQTLINLEFFRMLKEKYGMELEIYAWDAGNLDGSCQTYETFDSPKLKAQYPRGYAPIAKAAAEIGTRLGVWCGPDGFGDTDDEAKARHELMVSLCRDYNFALFKIDGVCGLLRSKKRMQFIEMIKECRKYSPDLVLLNHRLELGEGMKYATTFLWGGQETYVDVHIGNTATAPHHRGFIFNRGNVPGLLRLTEDHGVCISSCIDYFEDDLIYQAFGRCLILAPEIYGNPWLMRDDELPRLARIYNLHRSYRDILVDGILLPEEYGPSAVSRGNGERRFICTGNDSWKSRQIKIKLDSEIGLELCDKVSVILHHPYEKFVGEFKYGDTVQIDVIPFRASLIEVCSSDLAGKVLTNCEYEILHETDGTADKALILKISGSVMLRENGSETVFAPLSGKSEFDNTMFSPLYLASSEKADVPENAEQLYEAARFAENHDSLERRSLDRSGDTAVPEVKATRDAFFEQKTYLLRGPESDFAFDGRDDTFFDGISKTFFGGFRVDGGCLRVDFGGEYEADSVLIRYFDIDESMKVEVKKQILPPCGDFSCDLAEWKETFIEEVKSLYSKTEDILVDGVHNIVTRTGKIKEVTYSVNDKIRYLRLPKPMDRIYKIALLKDGCEIELTSPRVNNLIPEYKRRITEAAQKAVVTVSEDNWREGCYLAIALEGEHGKEGAVAVCEVDGRIAACPDRAPSFDSNVWECSALHSLNADSFYTYYLPVERDMCGKEITVHVLLSDKDKSNFTTDIYLCDGNGPRHGIEVDL